MITEKAIMEVTAYLFSAGCEGALVGSIWEHWMEGDEDGVLEALNYAWYMTTVAA